MSDIANKVVDVADKVKGQVKEQLDQANDSVSQLAKAGRGLVVMVSSEASKQFDALVETGEAQKEDGRSLGEQFKESFEGQFNDIKGSLDQVKLAALGLFTKARETGEKAFKDLVELGEGQQSTANTADAKEAAA